MTDNQLEEFRLPDGRLPVRLHSPRSAWYKRLRGDGEVLYQLATVRYSHKRPRRTKEELSEIARKRVELIKSRDPDHYKKAGRQGGINKGKNYDSKNRQNQKNQGESSRT